jgi:uncharacterized protein
MIKIIKKNSYIVIGTLFFLIGFIGAFLPILPTTPFMLLAAYFYSRSSRKIYLKLLSLPLIGDGINDWNKFKVIRTKAKVISCSIIYSTMIYLIFFSKVPSYAVSFASTSMFLVSVFILTRKSSNVED